MTDKIGFWTPIKYEGRATLGQKIREYSDSYFQFGGRVAVVMPEIVENGSTGTRVQEEKSSACWVTALKIASYFTLVLPVFVFFAKIISRSCSHFHLYQRTLVDGTQEKGTFVNGKLEQGMRVREGKIVFLRPKVLLGEVELKNEGIELNFAEVVVDGKKELIPVQRPLGVANSNQEYVPYPGLANEALLKMAQDTNFRCGFSGDLHYGSPIKFVLQHASNRHLQTKEFFSYLLTPNNDGVRPIHTLNRNSLLDALQLAKSENITIDLHAVDPNTNETLFSKWAGKGDVRLTEALLAMDPSAIRQTEGRDETFFMKAVLGGGEQEAEVLWEAMEKEQIKLTEADRWIRKAFKNDSDVSAGDLFYLSSDLQQKMFMVANMYICKGVLQKLRGMRIPTTLEKPEGPALFSYNMDAIDVENTFRDFLVNLRGKGLLLTKEEFAQKDKSRYYHKYDDIGRILGRDYIQQTAERLNLPYIKVPEKIAVIQPTGKNASSLRFIGNMGVQSPDLQIYAERIESIKRKATKDEMIGLLDLIEATGYNDFFGQNLFMGRNLSGEEGIYFIDTEYDNFSFLPSYNNIGESLSALMAREDLEWFQKELDRRFESFDAKIAAKKLLRQEKWAQKKPVFVESGFATRRKLFTFDIKELTECKIRQEAANE